MSKFFATVLTLTLAASSQTTVASDPAKAEKLHNRCASCHAIIKDG